MTSFIIIIIIIIKFLLLMCWYNSQKAKNRDSTENIKIHLVTTICHLI
jgi:hypothetical protein